MTAAQRLSAILAADVHTGSSRKNGSSQSAVEAGLALNPSYTVSRARAAWTVVSDDPTYLASIEAILEGMRKAGTPRPVDQAARGRTAK